MSYLYVLGSVSVGLTSARGLSAMQGMASGANAQMAAQMASLAGILQGSIGKEGLQNVTRANAAATDGVASVVSAMIAMTCGGLSGMMPVAGLDRGMREVSEDLSKMLIRAMIAGANGVGGVTAVERQLILNELRDCPAEELSFLKGLMDNPDDPMALAAEVGRENGLKVYTACLSVMPATSAEEQKYLRQLAQALGVSPETVQEVHATMGRPAP